MNDGTNPTERWIQPAQKRVVIRHHQRDTSISKRWSNTLIRNITRFFVVIVIIIIIILCGSDSDYGTYAMAVTTDETTSNTNDATTTTSTCMASSSSSSSSYSTKIEGSESSGSDSGGSTECHNNNHHPNRNHDVMDINDQHQDPRWEDDNAAAAAAKESIHTNTLRQTWFQYHLPPPDCTVYIAKSTIPNAGLGIFNGPIPKQRRTDNHDTEYTDTDHKNATTTTISEVVSSPHGGDVCIPFIDTLYHDFDRTDPQHTMSSITTSPFINYFWAGFVFGLYTHSIFHHGTGTEVFCPGFDTMINCHLGLSHLLSTSVPQYDDLSIPTAVTVVGSSKPSTTSSERYHRSTHAGSGAFTPYFNGTSDIKVTNVTIPPFTELFKDYGDHWFVDRIATFGHIPLSTDYHDIFKVLQKFASLRNVLSSTTTSSTTTSSTPPPKEHILVDLYETLLLPIKDLYDSRTLNALPPTFQDAIHIGNSSHRETFTDYLLQQHTTSIEYMQEYGTCIDQIRPGRSTLSNAGHGGFATRALPEGAIITASPLLIIPDERVLYMYNFTKYNHTWYRNYKKRKHYQLIYNYCFGHPYSTILLCPHGGGINYINHNQSLVNVKIEWTTTQLSYVHNTTLVLNGTMEDVTNTALLQQGSQLVFQYVATRDIAPDEELFLDYGNEWEVAWQYHVQQYPYHTSSSSHHHSPTPPSPKYMSAHEYNYYHSDDLLRTIEEQLVEPYPNNLQMRCHRSLYFGYGTALGVYEWTGRDYGLPCRILDRWIDRTIVTSSLHMDLYTVQIEYVPAHTVTEQHYEFQWSGTANDTTSRRTSTAIWVTRTDVPRSAIRFFDRPYTTDLHQPYTFRHYIQMKDELFPPQWKNLQ